MIYDDFSNRLLWIPHTRGLQISEWVTTGPHQEIQNEYLFQDGPTLDFS